MNPSNVNNAPQDLSASATVPHQQSTPSSQDECWFRCRLVLPGACGETPSHEIGALLRRRLRIAALITSLGFTLFFLRNLIDPQHPFDLQWYDLVWQGVIAALLLGLAILLWSRVQVPYRCLRGIEVVYFGILAAYFAWIQYLLFATPRFVEALRSEEPGLVVRLFNLGNIMRFFVLIVVYGTFVPSTWRRCAVVVGVSVSRSWWSGTAPCRRAGLFTSCARFALRCRKRMRWV